MILQLYDAWYRKKLYKSFIWTEYRGKLKNNVNGYLYNCVLILNKRHLQLIHFCIKSYNNSLNWNMKLPRVAFDDNHTVRPRTFMCLFKHDFYVLKYSIAGNFRGRKFSRFKGKNVWNNFCDFYFRYFKLTDIWISVGINHYGFHYRDSIYSPRNHENKNPAKISRYTVLFRNQESIQYKRFYKRWPYHNMTTTWQMIKTIAYNGKIFTHSPKYVFEYKDKENWYTVVSMAMPKHGPNYDNFYNWLVLTFEDISTKLEELEAGCTNTYQQNCLYNTNRSFSIFHFRQDTSLFDDILQLYLDRVAFIVISCDAKTANDPPWA